MGRKLPFLSLAFSPKGARTGYSDSGLASPVFRRPEGLVGARSRSLI